MAEITIYEKGKVRCKMNPNGTVGLTGYILQQEYPFEKVTDTGLSIWYRIYGSDPEYPDTFQICQPGIFQQHFRIIESEKVRLNGTDYLD